MAAAGRGRARGGQPDSVAAPHLRRRRRADAVARSGHRAGRHRPRELQLDRGLARHRAESRSVRRGFAESVRSHVPVSEDAWRGDRRRLPGVEDVQTVRSSAADGRRDPGHADRDRDGKLRACAVTGRLVAEDPRGMYTLARAGEGRDRLGQLRAPPAADDRRSRRPGDAGRAAEPADRRHHHRLVRPAGLGVSRSAVYERYWQDDTVNVVSRVRGAGRRSHWRCRQRILERLAPSSRVCSC